MNIDLKDGQILVFKDDSGGNRPLFQIHAKYKGEQLEAALWRKVSKKGTPFYSGTVNPVDPQASTKESTPDTKPEFDDDIPF